jgi:hypothetical protein
MKPPHRHPALGCMAHKGYQNATLAVYLIAVVSITCMGLQIHRRVTTATTPLPSHSSSIYCHQLVPPRERDQ